MNKGRVRDTANLNYKLNLVQKILSATGRSQSGQYAKRLARKTSGELTVILAGITWKI